MKTILTAIAIAFATITQASADVAEQLKFEAAKMEIRADELEIQIAHLEAEAAEREDEAKRLATESATIKAKIERIIAERRATEDKAHRLRKTMMNPERCEHLRRNNCSEHGVIIITDGVAEECPASCPTIAEWNNHQAKLESLHAKRDSLEEQVIDLHYQQYPRITAEAKRLEAEADDMKNEAANIKVTMEQLRYRAAAYRRKADEQ